MVNWTDIHLNFTPELQKDWEDRGFSYEECKEWMDIGLGISDADYARWLKDVKKVDSDWVLNYEGENKKLKKEYEKWLEESNKSKNNLPEKKASKQQIKKHLNAQEWLDENYPKEKRSLISELYIKRKNLEGILDLRDFVNLEKLDCSFNQLTGLKLNGLKKLWRLSCNDNLLDEFDYSSLNTDKLSYLNLRDNNLPKQDLSVFDMFASLQTLWIGSDDKEKISKGIHNRFYGTLKSLRHLTELERLHISNTDIDSGVDYLPSSITRLYFSSQERPESKVREIFEQLNSIKVGKKTNEDWKVIHPDFSEKTKKKWKQLGFNYKTARQWIEAGLQPSEYYFAAWLRLENHEAKKSLDLEKLKKEKRSVQAWLDNKYPLEEREWVNWLDISSSGLEGDLIITGFPNLERIDCYNNQLTSLTLDSLKKLIHFAAGENSFTNLTISNCPEINYFSAQNNFLNNLNFLNGLDTEKLLYLYISNNNFPSEDINIFSRFTNLKQLWVEGNNFCGDLRSLKSLKKLEKLDVAKNELESGFEYLPDSLKEISSVLSQNLEESTDSIRLLGREVSVPYYDFKYWKEAQPYFQWLKKELEGINPKLNVYDVLGNIFFNVKTGDFEGNLQSIVSLLKINKDFIDEKDKQIDLLAFRIQELENLIEKHKEKIVQAYLGFVYEKELLQELIQMCLELSKAKKQGWDDISKRRKKFNRVYEELESKLDKKSMKEVETILNGCEELVNWELELESRFNDKLLLLEEQKKTTRLVITTNLDSLKKRLQSRMEQQQLIRFIEEKLNGKIKGIEKAEVFPTWFSDICAIVINKERNHNLWIVVYEQTFGRTEEKVNCLKVANLPPIKEKWEEVTEYFKKALNSDYPAVEVFNNIYTFKLPSLVKDYQNIEKNKIKLSSQTNPDDYVKPYDIVKRKIKKSGGSIHHYAIYLGNGEVAHISGKEEVGGINGFCARIDTWESFLDREIKIEIHHPFIPFKRPEFIKEHIDIAVGAEYGKGKYNLLKDNCEHFATLCVYGLGMSRQVKPNTISIATGNADYLLQAIKESNEFFRKLKQKIKEKKSTSDSERSDTSEISEVSANSNWEIVQQLVESPLEEYESWIEIPPK